MLLCRVISTIVSKFFLGTTTKMPEVNLCHTCIYFFGSTPILASSREFVGKRRFWQVAGPMVES